MTSIHRIACLVLAAALWRCDSEPADAATVLQEAAAEAVTSYARP